MLGINEQLTFEFADKTQRKTYVMEKFATLYKKDTTGSIREWYMELEGDSYRSVSNVQGGSQVVSEWRKAEPKNEGKSNATTAEEQARSEVENRYQHKLDRGFFYSEAKVDEVKYTVPMLATEWSKRKSKVNISEGVFVQPKLDGVRCIARKDGLWTRSGKRITSCSHIEKALAPAFAALPDLIFDGELYNHDLREDFDKISGAVRKEQPDMFEQIEIDKLIQYHVYDCIMGFYPSNNFQSRYNLLSDLCSLMSPVVDTKIVKKVHTLPAEDEYEIDRTFGVWLEEGYEGQIIRLNKPYEHKRSNNLIKRKEFMSEEFPVLRVEEGLGNWSGAVKRFVIQLPDGTEGESGVRGTKDKLTLLWERSNLEGHSIPSWATVRFFGYTPDGKLRFPVVTDYGYGERND